MIAPYGILSSRNAYLTSHLIWKTPFKQMIEEMSSILWGLSLAFNIILILLGLPLCLLICCCCRKHQDALEKDLRMLARNHNILQEGGNTVEPALPQKKRVKMLQGKPAVPVQPDLTVQELEDPVEQFQMEDE